MMRKAFFVSLIVLVFSLPALAGEGSDTIGACRLMPELRYSYYEIPLAHDYNVRDFNGDQVDTAWRTKEHSAVVGVTWGVIDNLDLYTFVGARICSTIEGTADDVLTGTTDRADLKYVFDLGTSFTCGLGVRATFWRSPGGFYVGGGASVTYSVTHGKKHLRFYEDGVLVLDSLDDDGAYFQEQNLAAVADLHVGWNFKGIGLTPYLGGEYRWNKAYVRERSIVLPGHYDLTFREEIPFGVYVGLDYLINNRLYLNLEGHMVNRWGGSMTVGYQFDICGKPEPVAPAPAPAPVIEPKLEPMSIK